MEAPEVERVYEVWGSIINNGQMGSLPDEVFKPETAAYLKRFAKPFLSDGINLEEALIERNRLTKLWSYFLTDYQVCIGPTWSNLPWPINTDLDPQKGDQALKDSFIFIVPGNCLGLPSVALPMGVSDGIPTGVQIYSDLYREDLCLLAAEVIQAESACPTPIDPII